MPPAHRPVPPSGHDAIESLDQQCDLAGALAPPKHRRVSCYPASGMGHSGSGAVPQLLFTQVLIKLLTTWVEEVGHGFFNDGSALSDRGYSPGGLACDVVGP